MVSVLVALFPLGTVTKQQTRLISLWTYMWLLRCNWIRVWWIPVSLRMQLIGSVLFQPHGLNVLKSRMGDSATPWSRSSLLGGLHYIVGFADRHRCTEHMLLNPKWGCRSFKLLLHTKANVEAENKSLKYLHFLLLYVQHEMVNMTFIH